MKAYVMIKIRAGEVKEVVNKLRKIQSVKEDAGARARHRRDCRPACLDRRP